MLVFKLLQFIEERNAFVLDHQHCHCDVKPRTNQQYFLLFLDDPGEGVKKICEHLDYKPDEYRIGK